MTGKHNGILPPDDKRWLPVVGLASCSLGFVFEVQDAGADFGKVFMQPVIRHQLRLDRLNVIFGRVLVCADNRDESAVPV